MGGEWCIYQVLVGGFCKESIIALSRINYLYFEVWVGCERLYIYGWAPEMHNTLGLSQVGHLHLGGWHVHGSSHEGIVLSYVRSLMLPTLIRVK